MLKAYYKKKIFSAWKHDCRKLLQVKTKFKQNKLYKIMDLWYATASANGAIRRKYKGLKRVKDLHKLLVVFRALKQNMYK